MAHSPKKTRKEAIYKFEPSCAKNPQIKETPLSDAKIYFQWKVKDAYIDYDWPTLGWCNCQSKNLLKDIIQELQAHEGLTWQQVRQKSKHNHPWGIDKLPETLRKRLNERKLDDLAELYQIELGNKPRIWGYKDRNIFYLIWYDPKHDGCKTEAK